MSTPEPEENVDGAGVDDPAPVPENPWLGVRVADELLGSETIDLMEAQDLLGADVAAAVGSGSGRRWAFRADGEDIHQGVVDAKRLWELMRLWSNAIRHIGHKLHPGFDGYPGVALANTVGSVVVEFTTGIGEEPIVTTDGDELYSTVEAGRFLAALLSTSDSTPSLEALDASLRPLKGRALGAYVGLVSYIADHELSVDVVVERPEGAGDLVRGSMSAERAVQEAQLLTSQPELHTEREEVVGILDSYSWTGDTFTLIEEPGSKRITAIYEGDEEMRENLRRLQGKRVRVHVDVTRPVYDWLPKARQIRPELRLRSIERVEGELPPGV